MGSQLTKVEEPPQEQEDSKSVLNDESVPSTPILTPLDPRSPSVNIARTPLEMILDSKTNEDTPAVEENECIKKVLGIDPRSPTVEFNRTPIIISTVNKEKSKFQNKNFDNVRKSMIQTTPLASEKKVSTIIPPKLLGSSPVSHVLYANKRKSFVGLLETNIDFTETNLDDVQRAEDNLTENLSVDETAITAEVDSLQINSEADLQLSPESEADAQLPSEELLNEEPKVETSSQKEEQLEVTEPLDKTTDEKTINITAQVKDFDRKLTNLIYEDDSEDNRLCLRITKIKENNRTPLGTRNSNGEPRKSINKLKVSDKPRKSEISKIPVFKDSHCKKFGVQCENTPPSKMEEKRMKPKMTQWDADKTLVI